MLARRATAFEDEVRDLDGVLKILVANTAPELAAVVGVGTDVVSALLVAAGDNPQRLKSEATFAHLCGVSPIDASSGKTSDTDSTGAMTAGGCAGLDSGSRPKSRLIRV